MIHLCYLKIPKSRSCFQTNIESLVPFLGNHDLVLCPTDFFKSKNNIIDESSLDIEMLGSLRVDNILILDHLDFDHQTIRSIISLKSKRTEIIILTNNYIPELKSLDIKIQEYKDDGFNMDQISVLLSLKDNLPATTINLYLNSNKGMKNPNIKQIDNESEIFKWWKRKE